MVKINTTLVAYTATKLSYENNVLYHKYDDIDKAISNLKRNWSGTACDQCCRKAEYIKSQFKDARYTVVNDFVRFMRQQVGEGYEATEAAISSAANAFK